jgi:hypothetical protein
MLGVACADCVTHDNVSRKPYMQTSAPWRAARHGRLDILPIFGGRARTPQRRDNGGARPLCDDTSACLAYPPPPLEQRAAAARLSCRLRPRACPLVLPAAWPVRTVLQDITVQIVQLTLTRAATVSLQEQPMRLVPCPPLLPCMATLRALSRCAETSSDTTAP